MAAGCVCLVLGGLYGVMGRGVGGGGLSRVGASNRAACRWARLMSGLMIATTGFCGMALEIALVFIFQSLHGYVYTRMGLIVAAFMLGLVIGAPCGKVFAQGRRAWVTAAGLEVLLLALALAVPLMVRAAGLPALGRGLGLTFVEVLFYGMVSLIGWAVGAEFPLGNRIFCDAGGSTGAAAAVTDASDHFGAAAGALVMGVLLVPVLGIAASCAVLAAMKVFGLLCLGSAALALPRRRECGSRTCDIPHGSGRSR